MATGRDRHRPQRLAREPPGSNDATDGLLVEHTELRRIGVSSWRCVRWRHDGGGIVIEISSWRDKDRSLILIWLLLGDDDRVFVVVRLLRGNDDGVLIVGRFLTGADGGVLAGDRPLPRHPVRRCAPRCR